MFGCLFEAHIRISSLRPATCNSRLPIAPRAALLGLANPCRRGQVNCGELTNWDDYALTILDPHPDRPQACINADPKNPLCQIVGEYTLELNQLSTKQPFAHMAEHCPSKCPNYTKPANC